MTAEHRATAVLLHGQPGAASDWDQVIDRLPDHVSCVVADRPGYRSSEHPPSGLEGNARHVLDELDRSGVEDAVLVGHSFAGGIALTAASLAPERIRGLVLLSSIGPGCLDFWDRLLAAPISGPVCAVVAWSLTPWAPKAWLRRLSRRRGRPLEPHEYVEWESWANARHEHGAMWKTFLIEQRDMVRTLHELENRLPGIDIPVLIIADPADKMIPVATAQALAARLRRSRLMLVDRGGHSLARRTPEVVARAITEFLAEFDVAQPEA